MTNTNKFSAALAAMLVVVSALACGNLLNNQIDDFNKIVDECNAKVGEAKALADKTEDRHYALFSTHLKSMADFKAYKVKKADEAKAIDADFQKVVDMFRDVAKRFGDAQQLKVDDKMKEYAKMEQEAYAKQADAVALRTSDGKTFLDGNDPDKIMATVNKNADDHNKMIEEVKALFAKAEKFEKDNSDIFQKK